MAFPAHTALAAVATAAAVTLVRIALRKRLPAPPESRRSPWRPADVALLLGAVGLALAARLVLLESRVVDNDEPVGLDTASLEQWALGSDARLHPPLPALLMTWAGGSSDLAAARSVSALAGIATVALGFAAVRAVAARWAAALTGLWLAAMPAALHTSQLARGYSLAALGVVAAHVCLDRALATGKERWFSAYSLACLLALGSEYLALPALLGSAGVALWGARRVPSLAVGVVGALGAALCLGAVLLPFAWPSLSLGVGGAQHAPSGPWRALADVLALGSGPGAPWAALLALALTLAAARRGALGPSERRALGALAGALGALLLLSLSTAVRARYVLHVLPLFVCVTAVAASRAGRLGAAAAVLLALGHLALLPAYYSGTASGPELSTGRRTPLTFALLSADPLAPVAVVPEWAIAEASYRLERRFPGRDAGVGCPAALCVRGRRTLYGARAEDLGALLEREPRLYVWLRRETPHVPEACEVMLREAETTLLRCRARP